MHPYSIQSTEDIRMFFTALYERTGMIIFPEDDLSRLTDAAGQPLFPDDAAYLDEVLLDCFVFCWERQLDLHAIVHAVYESLQAEPCAC